MSDQEDRSEWMGRVWAWVRKVWPWAVTLGLLFGVPSFGLMLAACAMTYFVASNAAAKHAEAKKATSEYQKYSMTERAYEQLSTLVMVLGWGMFFIGTAAISEDVFFAEKFERICGSEISAYDENPEGSVPSCVKIGRALDSAHLRAWPVRGDYD